MNATGPSDSRPAAVFLDRDGVINEMIRDGYVLRWDEFRFRPGALSALRLLASISVPAVVVTNQSCVGRGLLTLDELEDIHRRLQAQVAASGGALARIEVCPHEPDAGCACRKPQPGLLLRAAGALTLDISRVAAVGDSESDLAAAAAAGCRWFYWVEAPPGAATNAGDIEVIPVASLWETACRIAARCA